MDTVLIVVDSLRQADVGCYGRDDDITPNIDRISGSSFVFDNGFSQSNYTDICLSTIMSGKYPREHGVVHHGPDFSETNLQAIEQRNPRFLPEILSDNGDTTIGLSFMGRWHSWGYDWYGVTPDSNSPESDDGNQNGFTSTVKDWIKGLPDPIYRYIAAANYRINGIPDGMREDCESITDLAIQKLADTEPDDDVFLFAHYMDVHPPYLPPDEYKKFTYDGENEDLSKYFGIGGKTPQSAEFPPYVTGRHRTMKDCKEAYDGAIHWVDEQIGRLFDWYATNRDIENTLFIITADHGHNFGEHGIFSDNCSLYDTSINIPLIVRFPSGEHERRSDLVEHTDILPTVLDQKKLEIPDGVRGRTLPTTEREYAFAEAVDQRFQALRTDEWKLINPADVQYLRTQYWYDSDGNVELYDITEDPAEIDNVAPDHPDVVAEFMETLDAEIETQMNNTSTGTHRDRRAVSDEEIEAIESRLRSLGYTGDDR